MGIEDERITNLLFTKKNIQANDPKVAELLKELYQTVADRLNDGSDLNYLESGIVLEIEKNFSDTNEVKNRQGEEILRTFKNFLDSSNINKPIQPERQLYGEIQEWIFNKVFGDKGGISEKLESYAESIIKLDYNQELPAFKIGGLNKNIYNYFGFIIQSIVDKISDSTVSKKVFDTVNVLNKSQAILVTDKNFKIRMLNSEAEYIFNTNILQQKSQLIFSLIPELSHLESSFRKEYKLDRNDFSLIAGRSKKISCNLIFNKVDNEENEITEFVFVFDFRKNEYLSAFKNFESYSNINLCINNINSLLENCNDERILKNLLDTLRPLYRLKEASQSIICNENKSSTDKNRIVDDEIDFNLMIKQIVNELQHYEVHDIKIDIKITSNLQLKSNWDLLHSSLKNLILNAIQFRDIEKDINLINISIQPTPDYILISVYDNGVGMLQAHLDSIFEKGFKINEIENNGSGYGLYFTKRNVEFIGGEISVKSSYTQKTEFQIQLPY